MLDKKADKSIKESFVQFFISHKVKQSKNKLLKNAEGKFSFTEEVNNFKSSLSILSSDWEDVTKKYDKLLKVNIVLTVALSVCIILNIILTIVTILK